MRPRSILIGAVLSIGCLALQMVATTSANSEQARAPDKRTQKSVGDTKSSQRDEVHRQRIGPIQSRPQPPRPPTTKQTKSQAPTERKGGNGKKSRNQSRVMRSTGQMSLGEQSDSWSPHSLVPTFVDQEQGDEMVALASDSGETQQMEPPAPQQQQAKLLPQMNSSAASANVSYLKRYQADRQQRELEADERFLARGDQDQNNGKQRPNQQADDYYADEEDEDEAEQLAAMAKTITSNDQNQGAKLAAVQNNGKSDFRSSDVSSAPVKLVVERSNASELVLSQRDSGGWLPTEQASKQQDQRAARSERLTSPFGGRELSGSPLTKTDMAIEYLRNILKTKQTRLQANSSTTVSAHVEQVAREMTRPDKNLKSFYPLPVHLREFAPVANRTLAGSQRLVATEQKHDEQQKTRTAPSDFQDTSSRFSVGDVKQAIEQQQQASTAVPNLQQQFASSPAAASVSSKQPAEEIKPAQFSTPAPKPPNQTTANQMTNAATLELSLMGPTNGSPLGGDYIEGQDDFPRVFGISSLQQAVQPGVEKESGGDHKALEKQQAARQTAQPNVADQMSVLASEQFPTVNREDPLHFRPQQAIANQHAFGRPQAISSVFFNLQKPTGPASEQSEFKEQRPPFAVSALPDFSKNAQVAQTQQNFEFDQAKLPEELTKTNQQQSDRQTPGPEPSRRPARPVEMVKPNEAQTLLDHEGVSFDKGGDEQSGGNLVVERPQPDSVQLPVRQVKQLPVYQPHQMISRKLPGQEQHQHVAQQAQIHHYQHQVAHGQLLPQPVPQEQPIRSSGHYKNEHHQPNYQQVSQQPAPPFPSHHQQYHHQGAQQLNDQHGPHQRGPHEHGHYRQQAAVEIQQPRMKPPKIISYNYFEGPNEQSQATNFQFGDSLLSSTGDVEHTLSSSELAAIQSQFMTAEHPVVPLNDYNNQQQQQPTHELSKLLADIKSNSLGGGGQNAVDPLKELASNESLVSRVESSSAASPVEREEIRKEPAAKSQAGGTEAKRKSLVVYLNHPRADEMSQTAGASNENLAQLISEQTSGDPFAVSAREFDSHGLAKDTKQLGVASLRNSDGLTTLPKEVVGGQQDRDGLSVVVIGDAYKYKKIVLLISAKSGGLKFVPMVKDMKK